LFITYSGLVIFFAEVYFGVSWLFEQTVVNPDGSTISNFCHLDINTQMEALYFSLSTMTTIGYGVSDYYFGGCVTPLVLVLWQAFAAITFQSVAIGLLFLRISRGQKRSKTIIFSDKAVIRRVKGVPYFMFRVAEMRRYHLIEANVRCYCIRHERYPASREQTSELQQDTEPPHTETYHFLTRCVKLLHPDHSVGHSILMSLPQVITHRMDESSPLLPNAHEYVEPPMVTRDSSITDSCKLKNDEMKTFLRDRQAEIIVLVEGTDDLTGTPVQARHSYRWDDIAWDCTFAPCVQPWRNNESEATTSDDESGWLRRRTCCKRRTVAPIAEVDFAKFHDLIPARDCEACPYVPM
jgi:hypothetical protein